MYKNNPSKIPSAELNQHIKINPSAKIITEVLNKTPQIETEFILNEEEALKKGFEEAQAEKEQAELMQPENIYKIVDVETDEEYNFELNDCGNCGKADCHNCNLE